MESSTFIGRSDLLIEPVIEVIPMSEYNAAEAKQSASVKWLLARAFGRNVPDEFADPFYTSSSNGAQLRPAVLNAMATGDVYALAASSIFHDELLANEGHRAVLQTLHRHFGQVVDADGNAITETLLRQTAPFRMNSHLMVIEYLMTALMRDLVNGQSVLSACRKLGPIAEGDQPPDGSEGATLYWINKVCENVRNRVESAAAVSGEEVPIIPEMDDVYEDICDGACVATVISYYRPEQLKFQDICFNDPMSLADCIHNLWLVKEFCDKHCAPAAIYHFSFEDVLYTHESLKPNFNVFLAELFHLLAGADVTDRPVAVSTRRSVSRLEPSSSRSQPRKLVKPMQSERKYNSRMNSMDSLIVDRDANAQRSFGTGLGARPLGTVSFLDVSEANNNNNEAKVSSAGRRSQSTYERSDTMPCVKLNSTPSLIRMQLEEKRRLYEANRLKRNSELAEHRQKLSKLAFFQLRGKEVDGGASSSREKMGPGTAVGGKSDESGFDQLTKNIKEMQEQMKRLYVEQEKLQQLVKSRHESTILLPTTAEAAAMAGCGQLLNAQSLVCLPTSTLGQFYTPMLLNKNGGDTTPTVLSLDEVPPGSKHQMSSDEQAFHLHSDGRSVSRLDPPLDISKSMTNWGMTCTGTKPPRRTWDSLANAAENGMPVEAKQQATSMVELTIGGEGCQKVETNDEWRNAAVQVQQSTPKVAAVRAQQMAKERDVSPGIGFVIAAEDSAKNDEEELLRKKEQKLAAVLKRREEMETRRAKVEEENAQRRARLQQKLEEQERRKRERELRRQRVLEEYQRKRAEQEAAEAGASVSTSMSVGVGIAGSQTSRSRTPRSSGQIPTSQSRSQIFTPTSSKTVSQMNATSLSGLDSLTDSGIPDSGPNEPALKLYVKPVQKSNRTLVYNAIHHSVLVGTVNSDVKSKVLEELAKSDSKHFLLLFRDQKCQYRGLYSWDQMSDTVHKLHGVGPKYCNEAMMNQLYKYDSGSKQFSSIPSRHLSATIDGFTLKDEFWQKRMNVTPRR